MRKFNTWTSSERRVRRAAMFAQQGGKCAYCGGAMTIEPSKCKAPHYATFEHIVPFSHGGQAYRNIVLACHSCNR